MEIELKLPHAENYRFNVSQKIRRKKELDEYVQKLLIEAHPGFNKDSLWDYSIYKADEKEKIIASVLSREFYIEKRVSDSKAVFYVNTGNGMKVRMFERHSFDEKGSRKNHRKIYMLFPVLLFAAVFLIVFAALTNGKKEVMTEEPVVEERIGDALNVFYLSNRFACVIEEHKGIIKHFQFNAQNKSVFVFSVYGCEPYSLVSGLEKKEEEIVCSCGDVTYSDGKESYEIKIEMDGGRLLQRFSDQKELFQIQGSITKKLNGSSINLVSIGTDERSGRIYFQIECKRENLREVNERLNEICFENNLFPAVLSEIKTEGKDQFLIKTELICLEERQKIRDGVAEEKLSEIFEKDVPQPEEKRAVQVSVIKKESDKNRNYKKIGSVKKEGKVYYYYRTAGGKIEISEVEYE